MKTKRIVCQHDNDREAVKQAADILRRGGLVAFPTETVYGLGVCVDHPKSLIRLRRLKERPDNKPFTLHIADKTDLDKYVPQISILDRQLIKKAWPGPLTIIFTLGPDDFDKLPHFSEHTLRELYYENTIGIRLPDQFIARELLRTLESPVVAPSANFAAQPPPTDPSEVLPALAGHIDATLENGPTRYKKASTIINLTPDGFEMIRAGVLDEAALRRMRELNILFVCSGNTCRSPMAEGLFKAKLAAMLTCSVDQLDEIGYKITSAGAMAFGGMPATPEAVQVCQEFDVDIRGHQARLLTLDMINDADYIFVMDQGHYDIVTHMTGRAEYKTELIMGNESVADPIGRPLEVYRKCARQISAGLDRIIQHRLMSWKQKLS